MSPPDSDPLEELKSLSLQVASATDIHQLRPVFYRLNAIAAASPDNLDVLVAVGDLKQALAVRGSALAPTAPIRLDTAPAAATPKGAPVAKPGAAEAELPTSHFAMQPWSAGTTARPNQQLTPQSVPAEPRPHIPAQPAVRPQPAAVLPNAVPRPTPPTRKSNIGIWIALIIGAIILLAVLISAAIYYFKYRAGTVAVHITTQPAGASFSVNGEPKCAAPCDLALPAGTYQVVATLAGYAPAFSTMALAANKPTSLPEIVLTPLPQSLSIISDFGPGMVALDGGAPVPITSGHYSREGIPAGHHMVKVTGPNREVTFSFDVKPGGMPNPSGTVITKNALAILVSTMGSHGRLMTSSGPWKLAVNGGPESEAGPAGVELNGLKVGENELLLGESAGRQRIKTAFAAAPALTAFLRPVQDAGTLTIAVTEDDAQVLINGQEQPERTRGGRLRLRLLGAVKVQVLKDGFQAPPAKIAELARDQDVRMEFTLTKFVPVVTPKEPEMIAEKPATVKTPPAPAEVPPKPVDGSSQKLLAGTKPVAPVAILNKPDPVPPVETGTPKPPQTKGETLRAGGIADFETPDSWHLDNGWWRHRGEAFLAFKPKPIGVFTFEVKAVHGNRARWTIDYSDPHRYTMFELDEEYLAVLDVQDGRKTSRARVRHGAASKDRRWIVRVDAATVSVTHSILREQKWAVLDERQLASAKDTQGKFGFFVLGNDEIALAQFRFDPR